MHSAWSFTSRAPPVHYVSHAKLAPGWALIWVNFDRIPRLAPFLWDYSTNNIVTWQLSYSHAINCKHTTDCLVAQQWLCANSVSVQLLTPNSCFWIATVQSMPFFSVCSLTQELHQLRPWQGKEECDTMAIIMMVWQPIVILVSWKLMLTVSECAQ